MRTWLVLIPLTVLVFLNRAPGMYVGECDNEPVAFEVDASGAVGVTCQSIHAVLTTETGSVTCKERAR